MAVYVGEQGLYVNERFAPIYSGTVHYWRLDPARWESILRNVLALGFKMIEIYIPWGVHEIAPGEFDFGHLDPAKNLPGFLDLCRRLGIDVCVRPGPHINAELTWFGFPLRVLQDPDIGARTASGAPAIADRLPQQFPIPSYASEKFFRETEGWFDALCPVLLPYLSAPIVACQVDNETCYFFRTDAYDLDYSHDALVLYRAMLDERYGSLAAINEAYGRSYASFEDIDPPRDFEAESRRDLPRLLDWVTFKEYLITAALKRIGLMLRQRGMTVPLYHDVAYQISTPIDMAALESSLDFVGTNLYANQEQYETIARRVRYQSGSQRLPFVPEFGAGLWWFHPRTFTPAEQEFITLAGLMHGLKAINFYMLVERDRWQGSPITRDNRLRPGYADFFKRLSDFLDETGLLKSEKDCPALLLLNYDLMRYRAAASTLNSFYLGLLDLPPAFREVEADFGFHANPALESDPGDPQSWLSRVQQHLDSVGVEFDLADTHLAPDRLARYPFVFVPTADFMDTADQHKLIAYATAGGHLIFGPVAPTLDRLMNPASPLGELISAPGTVKVGAGKITLLRDLSELDPRLLPLPYVWVTNRALRVTVRRRQGRVWCFVANPTDQPQEANLFGAQMRGIWNASGEASTNLTLPPYTVQIWEAEL